MKSKLGVLKPHSFRSRADDYFRLGARIAFIAAAAIVLGNLAVAARVVQFHYPRAVANDPLISPLKVRSADGDKLTLEDGRVLRISGWEGSLQALIAESNRRIDLEAFGGDSEFIMYARCRQFICGTPWTGLIEIPLIPDDVPRYRREFVALATLVLKETD